MGKINWQRVLLGGLLAGLLLNVVDFLLWGVILAEDMNAAMQALGRPAIDTSQAWIFVLVDFLFGIFLIWLYAAIRPRFGPGPRTAIIAGLAVWVLVAPLHAISEAPMGIFPVRLMLIGISVALVLLPAAALLGAKIYQES